MGSQWGKDKAYLKAKQSGYRSRAAMKLKEIIQKNPVIRPDDNILDLGAAPGSWLQVLREMTNGVIVGVDLNPILPIEGVRTIIGDFSDPVVIAQIRELMPEVNGIVCDASPKLSGQRSFDQARAIELNEMALGVARQLLKQGGNMIMKSFQGEDFSWLYNRVKQEFYSVRTYKAHTTRKGSTEMYIIAKNFIGTHQGLEESVSDGSA
ncbi:23S rRNA Um-2552 2'-O-methyltransferase [Methanospirillum hungatei JF-1]|jgi:23S rRNA (uridine2552-2'-O)-methyltransferase|uniref:Ribosomal RNA large subunit methyltransferase E n=1 Tax=Methanospirillum hungatei JF-1 (strain ATCC 27890 / DSM 864 / NBRC 100397 / JF-1) TaxID=323259 RepID=RLME_METHJ|nr:RlmE family RNA methyltransferase [Methanospirillum hungatei]Q2FNX6.1 RecName: Full=Ribosomal RNA large subunit methyltransferase E; AltName: Full=23S rRNA Um2552 methyltransferase; AltName: Full=rRNA (uridine-2'-O-)-methyltransferase [Methanospirillum hungatei JF-1]ABD41221.1 23S rRNA Um-2552 2'-O-methyltransferase [Methanospirillum hungatei JF-1]MBP9008245.1 RlmE family RNA methyltransferase [Methanospirillum sp.]